MNRQSFVKESLTRRRSVRAFMDKPVPQDWLDDMIDAAIAAPSGSNWQNQRFLVVTNRNEIERIGKVRFVWPYRSANHEKVRRHHPSGIIGRARVLILVFADASQNDARGNGEYYLWESIEIQNAAASIQNILTMATSYGLGSCWISASEKMNHTRLLSGQTWRSALAGYRIPMSYKIQGVVALGFPRRVDADGYALGEAMHGATIWASTDRNPREFYCIKDEPSVQTTPGIWDCAIVSCCSVLISIALRAIRRLDRIIHRVEYEKLLSRKESTES